MYNIIIINKNNNYKLFFDYQLPYIKQAIESKGPISEGEEPGALLQIKINLSPVIRIGQSVDNRRVDHGGLKCGALQPFLLRIITHNPNDSAWLICISLNAWGIGGCVGRIRIRRKEEGRPIEGDF